MTPDFNFYGSLYLQSVFSLGHSHLAKLDKTCLNIHWCLWHVWIGFGYWDFLGISTKKVLFLLCMCLAQVYCWMKH